jgi:hypothetical protein
VANFRGLTVHHNRRSVAPHNSHKGLSDGFGALPCKQSHQSSILCSSTGSMGCRKARIQRPRQQPPVLIPPELGCLIEPDAGVAPRRSASLVRTRARVRFPSPALRDRGVQRLACLASNQEVRVRFPLVAPTADVRFNGSLLACQARSTGSIPVVCSTRPGPTASELRLQPVGRGCDSLPGLYAPRAERPAESSKLRVPGLIPGRGTNARFV